MGKPFAEQRTGAPGRCAGPARGGAWGACLAGLALTLAQLLFVMSLSYRQSFAASYVKLFQFDSVWYENIAANGYHSVVPPGPIDMGRDNVAFFPGFPALARAVMAAR